MFLGGETLLHQSYRKYPEQLSLLVYHGTEDKVIDILLRISATAVRAQRYHSTRQITWCKASKELVDKIDGSDKRFIAYEGYYHECHNEVCPWVR